MNNENNKDTLKEFINKLSTFQPLKNENYIDCCIESIMGWNNKAYWERINDSSKSILEMDINKLCSDGYHIRGSSEKSNAIYKVIYKNEDIVGNDYHGYHLWAILNGISFVESKTRLNKYPDPFLDHRISHVWGCTKNIYLNNLPFNYFAIPSFCYCLSDRNNGGEIGRIFRLKLKKSIIKKCRENIRLYNKVINKSAIHYLKNLNQAIDDTDKHLSQRFNHVLNQFILIPINVDNKYIEDGLKIFEFQNNKIDFSKEYNEIKNTGFKNFI